MELKVWVEGIQRIVCGVTDKTTCQDVVYALAHATGKTGRFTLIERWRNNERLLAPHEHPLKVLMKWGEYSSDVHFILQRTALDTNKSNVSANNNANKSVTRPKTIDPLHGFTPPLPPPPPPPTGPAPETNWPSPSCKELKKTPTFSGRLPVPESGGEAPATTPSAPERKVNVVRGVPQQHDYSASQNGGSSLNSSFDQDKAFHFIVAGGLQDSRDSSCSVDGSYHSLSTGSALRYESPSAKRTVVDGINDSNLYSTAQYCLPSPSTPSEPIYARYDQPRCAVSAGEESPRAPPPYRNPPPPMTGPRHSIPPPYREPPRPRGPSPYRASPGPGSSPLPTPMATFSGAFATCQSDTRPATVRNDLQADITRQISDTVSPFRQAAPDAADDGDVPVATLGSKSKRNLSQEFNAYSPSPPPEAHYAQLVQLVNRQRDNLDTQQETLVRLEQDLFTWEEILARRQQEEIDREAQELAQLEEILKRQHEEITGLSQIESEWQDVLGEERRINDQLTRFRADVAAADVQLDQYAKTTSRYKDDIEREEQRIISALEAELSQVKKDVEEAEKMELSISAGEKQIVQDLTESDETVQHIENEIELLTQKIKEANLQSLSIAPADDLKILLEGNLKSGHGRRMLGSPRQLENAAPTNKNPHGVWV